MHRRQIDSTVAQPTEASAALAKHRPELLRIPANQLLAVNVDIPWANTVVRGAAPRIRAYADAIRTKLPEHPRAYVDHLEE